MILFRELRTLEWNSKKEAAKLFNTVDNNFATRNKYIYAPRPSLYLIIQFILAQLLFHELVSNY